MHHKADFAAHTGPYEQKNQRSGAPLSGPQRAHGVLQNFLKHWPTEWLNDSVQEGAVGHALAVKTTGAAFIAAGNAWPVYAGRWPAALTVPQVIVLPTAAALLRLAPAAWAAGEAVPPEKALPLYIRDKVAQTTDERLQIKAQQAAAE